VTARLAVLASIAAGVALCVGVATAYLEGDPGITDTPVYRNYGEQIVSGEIPYRDFPVEYPPVALLPFVLPAALSSTPDEYDAVFVTTMIFTLALTSALLVLTLHALRASPRRTAFSLAAYWAGMLFLGAFVTTRFDLFAGLVTLAAVCAILYRRSVLGPVLLGVAIATKLFPAVLLPLLVARAWSAGGRRAGLRCLGLGVGTAFLIYVPFLLLAPDGVLRSIWRQLGRPLQIESLGSAVLLALHHAFAMPLAWASGSGSQNLTGTVSGIASTLTTVAGAAALLLVWIRFARGDAAGDARFARYAAAAVVAFVAFGKVLSPQFLVWLLAVVVLVQGSRGAVAMALLVLACGLTRLWFPDGYWDLVRQFDSTASWLVLARDIVLVALFASLVVPVRERAAEAEAPAAITATVETAA
jgi:uncharacterized membrane protein